VNIEDELYKVWTAEDNLKSMTEEPYQGLRGGNSGRIREDGTPIGSSDSSCPRRALLRAYGVEAPHDMTSLLTFRNGFAWEKEFESLAKSPRVTEFKTDVKVSAKGFAGSVDAIANIDGKPIVFELKTLNSLSAYEKVLSLYLVPDSYICQIANYMLATKIPDGLIVFRFISWVPNRYLTAGSQLKLGEVRPKIKQIAVSVDKEWVSVEGNRKFPTEQLHLHKQVVLESIKTKKPYPIRLQDEEGKSGCYFCPFKAVCDKNDLDPDNFDFIQRAKESLYE
jgi:hypothetical protein